MFINDVHKKEEIQTIATQDLKKYGIKFRLKKSRAHGQASRPGKKFFKVPLENLETETVTLPNGQQLIVPKRVREMCSFILTKVQTEGIFRKEGSKSRQNEIKLSLDRGCLLGNEHHVIDVAAVLKSFLRELPEPLIPSSYHELFLRCSIGENRLRATMLACLLLPTEHLSLLSYLMQFFHEVASYSSYNKMNNNNLAILIGPNIFPMDEKLAPKTSLVVTKICDITKMLIENSRSIGLIPDYIIDQIGHVAEPEFEKRRKKRRSGSLTRMLSGLKKIVTNKNDDDLSGTSLATPDLLLTPVINDRSVRKKKTGENGLSLKKKKEILSKLPDCALLSTPFTPSRTPISKNPNGNKLSEHIPSESIGSLNDLQKEKKMHWYMRSKSVKNLDQNHDSSAPVVRNTQRNSLGGSTRHMLERRWSAVSNAANFRKKKRTSCASTKKEIGLVERKMEQLETRDEPDYVRVSKTEYDDIQNRVSAIERRISMELDQVQLTVPLENNENINHTNTLQSDNILNVQNAYEKTLDYVEPLSPTTDQLAKRLSRDLKIRRSAEQRMIRSPSARKIGTIRRRSGERERKSSQLVRHQSWHVSSMGMVNGTAPLLPRVSMRRKKNLIHEELNAQASSTKNNPQTNVKRTTSFPNSRRLSHRPIPHPLTPKTNTHSTPVSMTKSPRKGQTPQRVSFDLPEIESSQISNSAGNNTLETSNEHWVSAEGFFTGGKGAKTPVDDSGGVKTRASIAKLRSQNMGMVRAKAKTLENGHLVGPKRVGLNLLTLKEDSSIDVKIRESVALLRTQHVGMVKARAKLFDSIQDSDTSATSVHSQLGRSQPASAKKVTLKTGHKIGTIRTNEARMSYRVKALRSEERTKGKKSLSPRRRNTINMNSKKLQQIGKQYIRNKESTFREDQLFLTPRRELVSCPRRTPNNHPRMKAPLSTKTPKRLCRTPAFSDRKTPVKVLPQIVRSTPM